MRNVSVQSARGLGADDLVILAPDDLRRHFDVAVSPSQLRKVWWNDLRSRLPQRMTRAGQRQRSRVIRNLIFGYFLFVVISLAQDRARRQLSRNSMRPHKANDRPAQHFEIEAYEIRVCAGIDQDDLRE